MSLIPIAGLAIDFSILYAVKARLQSAVDSAAIGAGYKLQRTTNMGDATQLAAINSAASRYFTANFPTNFFGASQAYYSSTPSTNNSTGVRSVYVHAEYKVPMIFMRVLHIPYSNVAAQATVNVRYTSMMIVVDRSGSVLNGGANTAVTTALNTFVANSASSVFIDGRDYVGMASFGGNWKLDYAPVTNFQTAASTIGTAINHIPFDSNSSTNTAEGLYQGWYQLQKLNQTGALNVILLLTDGRPSAFTGQFSPKAGSTCLSTASKNGVLAANVGANASQWPPPQTLGNSYGIQTLGVMSPDYSSLLSELLNFVSNSLGCVFSLLGASNVSSDISTFPALAGPVDNPDGAVSGQQKYSTTGPYYVGEGQNVNDPRAVRYAAFNVADNIATAIRTDTTLRPVVFVIGLNEASGEPLDADWLARVANDPTYIDSTGNSVYQTGQTSGLYYNVSASGLAGAFTNISSQILRLAQ
jgi:Flp pilus assembly protein TadG